MNKRILKLAGFAFAVLCLCFLCVSFVFAATKQDSDCSLTVKYDIDLLAIVEIKVGSGDFQTVFNNTNNANPSASSEYFFTSRTQAQNSTNSIETQLVQIKVTNYTTDSAIKAIITLPNNLQSACLCDSNNDFITNNTINISNSIAQYDVTPASATSSSFYVQALFPDSVIPVIVELTKIVE